MAMKTARPTERNRGDWIQTYTGRQFYPLSPSPDDIDIRDIAHALSLQCRFSGHTREFYSVAQHCCIVADTLGPSFVLQSWGLMHDAAEAYLVDVPRPIKPHLIGYKAMEQSVMQSICRRFDMRWPAPPQIKTADDRALMTEARDLMGPKPAPWALDNIEAFVCTIIPWEPKTAEREFLRRAGEYGVCFPQEAA